MGTFGALYYRSCLPPRSGRDDAVSSASGDVTRRCEIVASRLAATADCVDWLIAAIGRAVAWLALAIVLLQFAVVVLRYAFGVGSIWLSESVIYGHAALFLLAAAWTLQVGGHVRVDIFYADAAPRTRALVDLFGALILLLPFMAIVAWFAIPYVARSWSIFESSRETSGLPFVYLLKALIPIFAGLMALQGISQALRAALVLRSPAVPQ
jgi:TRAP-type mannitol/chloroaromatic compound transport system permease small subunit